MPFMLSINSVNLISEISVRVCHGSYRNLLLLLATHLWPPHKVQLSAYALKLLEPVYTLNAHWFHTKV